MKPTPRLRGAVFVALLVVSLALYWAAEAGSRALQVGLLALLGAIALTSVWAAR